MASNTGGECWSGFLVLGLLLPVPAPRRGESHGKWWENESKRPFKTKKGSSTFGKYENQYLQREDLSRNVDLHF